MHDDRPAPPHDAPALPPWVAWSLMLALGLAIWACDAVLHVLPESVEPWGWRLLAVFAPTILGLMLRPLPGGAIVLLAITLTLVLRALPTPPDTLAESKHGEWYYGKALAGYANSSVWLVVAAFFLSRALIKT